MSAALALALALSVSGAVGASSTAGAALPSVPGPVVARAATDPTADALPTVQVDGVVWTQAIVGNTVYAGGNFANARPAGAAPKTNLTPRANLLAYNLTTGALITSFAPTLNGQVKVITASPDGSRIYVGGSFTTVNGVGRYRIAAFDTATGALISTFKPIMGSQVNAITATNTTVYAGGFFTTVSGVSRTRLAALSASNGALLSWAPTADNSVNTMVLTPDGSKVIVGGSFASINGQPAYGLVALDATSAAIMPWAITSVVYGYGTNSAILNLSTDGHVIYGTAYHYNSGTGNLEGTFAADPTTGAVVWIADCHGDSYGIYGSTSSVYVVSHSYDCSSVGGFPFGDAHRATAFTRQATGSNVNSSSFNGQPSPSMVNWFPTLTTGTFTGQGQAAWSVTGSNGYVVLGGEFPSVNGTPQQGLVRFATAPTAPSKLGPVLSGASYPLTASGTSTPTLTWGANWDPDDLNLTYRLVRDGVTATPLYTSPPVASTFWTYPSVPAQSFTDTTASPGTHTYQVLATDPSGNTAASASVTVTVPAPPKTLFGSSTPTTGAINGGFPVTLGVKFTSSVGTGVRFWKGAGNNVSLWSSTGTQLATATVTAETSSGWQSALFASPVALTPGTTYIAAYYAPIGYYAEDDGYFNSPLSNPPLSAPVGASVYYPGVAFPSLTYANTNYWVDPLFVPA